VKRLFDRVVLRLLQATGMIALWRFRHRREIAILMMHGVMDGDDGPAWTPLRPRLSRARLAQYLAALSRHYHFVSLAEAVDMIEGRRPLKEYSLVLSFDDGYRNNFTHALPVARRFAAPISVFVSTGKIGARSLFSFDRLDYVLQHSAGDHVDVRVGEVERTLPLGPRRALARAFAELRQALKDGLGADLEFAPPLLRFIRDREAESGRSLETLKESDDWAALLDWEQVAALAADPLVEVGSHSVDHTRLGLADDDTVRVQLDGSKREIEQRTGRPCPFLAYPNGSYSAAVAAAAREAGYACGLTTDEGLNATGADVMALRRIPVPPEAEPTALLALVAGLTSDLSALKARLTGTVDARRPASAREAYGPS